MIRPIGHTLTGPTFAAILVLWLASPTSAQPAEEEAQSQTNSEAENSDAVVEPASIQVVDPQVVQELEERLRDAEDLLDAVETRSLLQRIQWSGDYRTLLTHGRYSGPSPDGARDAMGRPIGVDLQNDEQWLHRLRLNMEANPYKDLRFTGRLTMFKRFGTNTATLFAQDSSESRIPRNSAVRLERAWVDWFVHDKVALSMGRVSYSNGSPGELRENLMESDATWGMQMVDGEYETVNITFAPSENLLMRTFYASWAFPQEEDINSLYLPLTNGTKNLRIIGGNIDFKAPSLGAFSQLGFYAVPKFRPFTVPISNPNPPPNPGNAPPPFDGSLVFPSSKPHYLGSYANLSALILFKDLGGSGLDLFASAAIGFLKPEPGAAIRYNIGPPDMDGNATEFPLLGLASAEKCWTADPMVGLVPKSDCETTKTYFGYFGARYTVPLDSVRSPKVGFEYNFASRHWISFNQPRADLTNKLANRGSSYEAYVIVPFHEKLFARLHALVIQSDYGGGFFGAIPESFGGTAPPTDAKLTVIGATLDASF